MRRCLHPLTQQIWERYQLSGKNYKWLSWKSGYQAPTIRRWFSGDTDPYLTNFVNLAEALGYEVVLVKKEEA